MSENLDERRKELLVVNTQVKEGVFKFPLASKLDTSIKKNTTFLHRIRLSINSEQASYCIRDVKCLSLDKYLGEIINDLKEGLLKISKNDEIFAAVEIINALHQRYTVDFTPYILSHLLNTIIFPSNDFEEKDLQPLSVQQRAALRIVMELRLVGIIKTFEDVDKDSLKQAILKYHDKFISQPIMEIIVKLVALGDGKGDVSLTTLVSFVKRFRHLLFSENDLLVENTRVALSEIFLKYTNETLVKLSKMHENLLKVESKMQQSSIRTGKILEEYSTKFEQHRALFEKFKVNCEYLTSVQGLEMPSFAICEEKPKELEVNKDSKKSADLKEIWGSQEEARFYTRTPNYSQLTIKNQKVDLKIGGEKVSLILNQLNNSVSEKDLDRLCKRFIESNLYNKATKNRIMKFFIETPDTDNVKSYARFLKTCYFLFEDMVDELVSYLDNGFRNHLYQSQLNFKFIIFYVELIKFRLVPTHLIFHKINGLTKNITSTNNIDILTVFYERVGRFLLNDPEYGELMASMVDLLKSKMEKETISLNERLAIDNLLSMVDSAPRKISARDKGALSLTVQQRFLYRLITIELSANTIKKILKILQKFDFQNDDKCQKTLISIFTNPHMINFENIDSLSSVLSKLSKDNKFLLPFVVDAVVEKVTHGLELNDYRMNRQRLVEVKYIAELYNSKLVYFKFVVDLCHKIMCYGYPSNQPLPNSQLSIDLPNNYFRVYLCCCLLTSLKFHEKSEKDKSQMPSKNRFMLVSILAFFQYYLFCKEHPLPIEVNFKISELFEKYSFLEDVKRFQNLGEAIGELRRLTISNPSEKGGTTSLEMSKKHIERRVQSTPESRAAHNNGSNTSKGELRSPASKGINDEGTTEELYNEKTASEGKYNNDGEASHHDIMIVKRSAGSDDDNDDSGNNEDIDEENEDVEYDDEDDDDDDDEDGDDEDDDDENQDDDDDDDDEDEDEDDDDEDDEDDDDDDGSDDDSASSDNESKNSSFINPSTVDIMARTSRRIAPDDPRLAEELDKTIREMASESSEHEKKLIPERSRLNLPLPKSGSSSQSTHLNGSPFRLLTKNGDKTGVKSVHLPANNKFASAIVREMNSKQQNIEKTMNLVMNMDD